MRFSPVMEYLVSDARHVGGLWDSVYTAGTAAATELLRDKHRMRERYHTLPEYKFNPCEGLGPYH